MNRTLTTPPRIAAAAITVAHDHDGVQQAARALLEEGFQLRATQHLDADSDAKARALDQVDERLLSPGYYSRAAYLMDLAASIESGVTYSAGELPREDVRGLQCIRNARAEFERDHPSCSNCGARQESKFASKCIGCGVDFLRGDS